MIRRTSTDAAGVHQRVIKKIRRHMFVFVTNRAISATNRALRPAPRSAKSSMAFAPSGVPAFPPTSDLFIT
jgi:hypothetical protein